MITEVHQFTCDRAGFVTCLAVTPDGRTLLGGANGSPIVGGPQPAGGSVQRWELQTGRHLGGLPEPVWSSPHRLTVSADGRYCVSVSSNLRLHDLATGRELRCWRQWDFDACDGSKRKWPPWPAAFSPDSRSVVAAYGMGELRTWDVADEGPDGRPFVADAGRVLALAFSPDGRLLASGGWDGSLRMWDAASGRDVGRFPQLDFPILSLAFSPDGKRLATGSHTDHKIRLWDAGDGRLIRTLEGHRRKDVQFVAFLPCGRRVLSAGDDGTLRLWDADSGAELAKAVAGYTKLENYATAWPMPVLAAALSPAGDLAVTSTADFAVRSWKLEG